MSKKVMVGIKGNKESAQEFVAAWKRAENGELPEEPVHRLYFEDMETLFKTLTPRRYALLKTLHKTGASSIRALSKAMNRDYKNIYQDVQTLDHVGLVIKGKDGRFSAPWNSIVSEFPL